MVVTDHDTIDGVNEAQRAGAALGLQVIRGVELSAKVSLAHSYQMELPDDELEVLVDQLKDPLCNACSVSDVVFMRGGPLPRPFGTLTACTA